MLNSPKRSACHELIAFIIDGVVIFHSCQFMHTETKCYAWSGGGGGGGGGSTGGGGGGTGTTGGTVSSIWELGAAENIIKTARIRWCNWPFTRVGTTTWQAATVKKIRIGLIPDGPIEMTLDVGVPYWSEQQQRIIHQKEAQEKAEASAWEAMVEVEKMYNRGQVTAATVPWEIAKRMQKKLNQKMGFVTDVCKVSNSEGTNGPVTGSSTWHNPGIICPGQQ